MPVHVLVATSVGGLPSFNIDGLKALFEVHPEFFGHPHLVSDFDMPREHQDLQQEFSNCLVDGEKAYFLDADAPAFRMSPWLHEKYVTEELWGLLAGERGPSLKVLVIPDDVKWSLYKDCDGSESVQEIARTWR